MREIKWISVPISARARIGSPERLEHIVLLTDASKGQNPKTGVKQRHTACPQTKRHIKTCTTHNHTSLVGLGVGHSDVWKVDR